MHPIFLKFNRYKGLVPAGYHAEFTGAMISTKFVDGWELPDRRKDRYIETEYPPVNEELFEYISLLEALSAAKMNFTMIELGAGYGRWIVNAAKAAEQMNISFFLIGVEAEPSHFNMMKEHFRNNKINPDKHMLIKAAVSDCDENAFFQTGHSNAWWGQYIVKDMRWWQRWGRRIRKNTGKYKETKIKRVKSISLKTILNNCNEVDLIDLDIQGEEYNVLNYQKMKLIKK